MNSPILIQHTKSTLVLGASLKPQRYSHIAIDMLRSYGHPVHALGLKPGTVADVEIANNPDSLALPADLDTITLYLNPQRQAPYREWILGLQPKRVIFNPGTENPAFARQLREAGIEPVYACTLVMLRTEQY